MTSSTELSKLLVRTPALPTQRAVRPQKVTPLNDDSNLNLVPVAAKTAVAVAHIPTAVELHTTYAKLKKIGITENFEAHTLFAHHTGGIVYVYDGKNTNPHKDALFQVYKAAAFVNAVRDKSHGETEAEMTIEALKDALSELNEKIKLYHEALKAAPEPLPDNQIGRVFEVLSQITRSSHYLDHSFGNKVLNNFVKINLAQAKELANPKEDDTLPRELLYDTTKIDQAIEKVPKLKQIKSSDDRVSKCSLSRIVWAGVILGVVLISGARLQNESLCPKGLTLRPAEFDRPAPARPEPTGPHPDSLKICEFSERGNAIEAIQFENSHLPVSTFADRPVDEPSVDSTEEEAPIDDTHDLAYDDADESSALNAGTEVAVPGAEPWYEEEAPSILSNLGLYGLALSAAPAAALITRIRGIQNQ